MADEALVPVVPVALTGEVSLAPEADATAALADSPVVGGEDTPVPKEAKTFTQEEMDSIIGERLAKAERKQRKESDRRIAQITQHYRPPEPEPQAAVAKPLPDKFQTTEDYVEALADWKYEQKRATEQVTQHQREAHEYQQNIDGAYSEIIATAEGKYADFSEALTTLGNLPIPNAVANGMKEAIAHSDNDPELLYFLGKNTAEAIRISKLSPIAAAREIGKIEAKLAATPPAPRLSAAPAPISPLNGTANASPIYDTTDPRSTKLPTHEWIKLEEQRMRRKWQAEHA